MKVLGKSLLLGLAVLAISSGQVEAAAMLCPAAPYGFEGPTDGIADNVTTTTSCWVGSDNNDALATINADYFALFGTAGWILADKSDGTDGDQSFIIDGGHDLSGTWSFTTDGWGPGIEVILTLTDGNSEHQEPRDYVGYQLAFGVTSGSYLTPFANSIGTSCGVWTPPSTCSGETPKEISHWSVFYRALADDGGVEEGPGQDTVIPEPTSLALLGTGLLLAGFLRRRMS